MIWQPIKELVKFWFKSSGSFLKNSFLFDQRLLRPASRSILCEFMAPNLLVAALECSLLSMLLQKLPVTLVDFHESYTLLRLSKTIKMALLSVGFSIYQRASYDNCIHLWRQWCCLPSLLRSDDWNVITQRCAVRCCSQQTGQWIPWNDSPANDFKHWNESDGMTCSSIHGSLSIEEAISERHKNGYFGVNQHHVCLFPSREGSSSSYVVCSRRCYRFVKSMLEPLMTNPILLRATTSHHEDSYAFTPRSSTSIF